MAVGEPGGSGAPLALAAQTRGAMKSEVESVSEREFEFQVRHHDGTVVRAHWIVLAVDPRVLRAWDS